MPGSCPATPLATCVGGIDTPDVGGKVTFNAAAAGEVFWIIVDGWGSGCGNVTFKITAQDAEIIYGAGACADTLDNDGNGLVDCYDPSCVVDATSCAGGLQGSTCASPIQTTELIGFSADTCLYSNDFKANSGAGCSSTSSSNTAKDLVIEFAAPAAGPYAVKLNAAFDSVMNVVAGNTAGCPASPITTCVGGVDTPDLGGKVSFTAQAAGDLFYIVVDGWGSSCGLIELEIVTVDPEAGSCADDVDNDLDGKIDCLDADCDSDPVCDESGYANGCGNDVDDDGDGKIDCADANCVLTADCNEASFTDGCTNTTDDDGDTKIDCADWNCKAEQASVCATPPGDVCGMADGEGLVVDTLPYLSTGLDTCDFAADHIINTGGGCTNHQESKDVVYAFTPMNDMTVAITLTAVDDTDDTVLNVSTVCAGNLALPTCVASDDVYFDDLLGDTGESVTIDVDAGTTYYIYVNGWGAADCAPYDLTVEEVQP